MAAKVLVVDDESAIVDSLEASLKTRGYRVITALNRKNGLEAAKRDKPDLILLDVNMPRMSGFEVLEALKKDQKTASIPIIMLTAEKTQDDITRGIQHQADKYLTKPFQMDRVMDEVAKSLAFRL